MSEPRLVRFSATGDIKPSPVNDSVYRPPQPTDADIIALAESMTKHGVLEPLVITTDGYIMSGHRRHCAATVAGLAYVPVFVEDIRQDDPEFVRLLVDYNRQRQKSLSEVIAEQVVADTKANAHAALRRHRRERSDRAVADAVTMDQGEARRRSDISAAKQPMLDAVVKVLDGLSEFWPLSLRTVHYNLLNDPPLRHAKKPGSRYRNDKKSYTDLSDLLVRARLDGLVPFDALGDETRPIETWNVHRTAADFVRSQIRRFMKDYWRDLLQSQPNHIEVVGEKNTLLPMVSPVAFEYTVPLTIGRGYCSLPPRKAIVDRWKASGKDRLVLVFLSDHDPDGEVIADSFLSSTATDFGIPTGKILAVRAALTADQCREHSIPTDVDAKPSSKNYQKFVAKHGTGACELEAVPPKLLQQLLRDALDSVLDLDAFKAEQDREADDAREIDLHRRRAIAALGVIDGD